MKIIDFNAFERADYDNDNGGRFWGNIGAGILVFASETKRFLVSMRSKYVNEPHTYGVVGGKVDNEDDLDLKSEALRELDEETGYEGTINLTELSVYKNPTFEYHTFLGVIEKEYEAVSHEDHAWENDFFKWVTYEELVDLKPIHFGLKYTLDKCEKTLSELK